MLPPVGETPALFAPVSKAHTFDVVGVLQRYAARAFAKDLYERPEEFKNSFTPQWKPKIVPFLC
jgi:hypothetical protein